VRVARGARALHTAAAALRVARGARGARALHATAALAARFLASDPIDPVCGQVLRERGHELVEVKKTPKEAELLALVADFDGLIVRSGTDVNAAVIGAGRRLQLIGRAGVGVDNVDLAAATRAGIIVMNT
jgi:D-3-phosphoglycerate dehydrogenase